MDPVLYCIEQRVSDEQNDRLLRKVNYEEVKAAVFSMHPEKYPGPDVFNPAFIKLIGT